MPTVYALLPDAKPHFLDSAGDPLSGGKLFVYTAGSSTKATTYTESDGLTPNANPIVLNSRGEPGSGVYAATGSYKLVLAPSNDTDPPASAIWTRDDVTPINDVANATAVEFASTGLTPTYIGATSFSLVGDQTTNYHVGRRFKATNSGGTVYGYISASAYTSLTTVTVVNDSGTLDAGLSDVQLSFLRNDNLSLPAPFGIVGASGQVIESDGTDAVWGWRSIVQRVTATYATFTTHTTTMPADDTIPQQSGPAEGSEFLTASITPKHADNRLFIRAVVYAAPAGATSWAAALFQDSTAGALAVGANFSGIADNLSGVVVEHEMAAGTTSATTFKIRAGANSGNLYSNGVSGGRRFGGVLVTRLTVEEYAA